uniref:N-acetylgalactosamine-6-sulfatase n=1 Tax=Schlesneria paludicola TaxID=360056 RepID=A0A7C2JXQ0_9PLAN
MGLSSVGQMVWIVAVVPCVATTATAANRPPNIVLFVSDDQGYHDMGALRPGLITPHLDRLAREGTRLTSFYVAWPACTPSRAAFLTGRYPQRNGVYDMIRNEAPDYGHRYTPEEYAVSWERIGGLDEREVLIAQVLKDAGYACGLFGKWDLGVHRRYLPLQRGFDDFYGFVNTGIDYFTHERYGVPSMYRNNAPTTKDVGTYCTALFEREALRFLKEHHQRPFFLYVPFNAPHGASSLDPKIRGAAQGDDETKKLYPDLLAKSGYEEKPRYGEPADSPNAAKKQLEFLSSITRMDQAIGSVLKFLDDHQLADNTLVLFFSDNGGSGPTDQGPLRGRKGQTFEGGVRVLALARFPGRIPAGTTNDQFLTSLEVFPTFAALAKAPTPDGVIHDGFDMLPVLSGQKPSPRSEMYWKRQDWEAARVGNWKWVRHGDQRYVFNLADDVSEKTNLLTREPQKRSELEANFQKWQAAMEAAEPRGPFRDY